MTIGKKTALTVGVVGALGLGMWLGNEMVNNQLNKQAATPVASVAQPVEPAPVAKPRTVRARRATTPEAIAERTEARNEEVKLSSVAVTSPDLHAILKPVLNRGANLTIAGEGFRDGEQFATIAHAARNTSVPFMVLKHRVLDEGKTLADAISEFKPDLDARNEAERARSQARDDLAAIASN